MSKNKREVLRIMVCVLPLIIGAVLYSDMPDIMPVHWNSEGAADGFAAKWIALFVIPGLLALFSFLMPFLLKADPKYENMGDALKLITLWTIPVLEALIVAIEIGGSFYDDLPVTQIVLVFCGILFILIGIFLPRTGQSYTMGIKLPWTLNSEENWVRTHKFGGRVWIIGGLVLTVTAIVVCNVWIFLIVIAVMILAPCIYSYLLYKKGI